MKNTWRWGRVSFDRLFSVSPQCDLGSGNRSKVSRRRIMIVPEYCGHFWYLILWCPFGNRDIFNQDDLTGR